VPLKSGYTRVITPSFLKAARDQGIRILPWTINEQAELQRDIAMNVYGINTDYPSRLVDLLQQH